MPRARCSSPRLPATTSVRSISRLAGSLSWNLRAAPRRTPRLERQPRRAVDNWLEQWRSFPLRYQDKRLEAVAFAKRQAAALRGLCRQHLCCLGKRLGDKRDPAFDPRTERFEAFPLPDNYAGVRQFAGRKGEVWGAQSAADKLFMSKMSSRVRVRGFPRDREFDSASSSDEPHANSTPRLRADITHPRRSRRRVQASLRAAASPSMAVTRHGGSSR